MDDETIPRVATAKRARMSSVSSQLTTATKVAALDRAQPEPAAIRCELPPHGNMMFADTTAYETHYRAEHANRCTKCHNNFPTPHFLELHISEEHDSIAAAKRDAGEKTYGCFIEGCEKVCSDWRKRRSHLVDKHGFPRNYDFFMVKTGIDGRRSLLRAGVDAQGHRKSSRDRSGSLDSASSRGTAVSPQMSESGVQRHDAVRGRGTSTVTSEVKTNVGLSMDAGLDNLTSGMSALRMVPRSVHFGRKKGKSGLVKG